MNRRRFLKTAAIAAALFPFARIASALPSKFSDRGETIDLVSKTAFLMGSVVTFDIYCSDRRYALKVIDQAVKRVREIENRLSVYSNTSEVGILNQSKTQELSHCSPDLISMIQQSKQYSGLTTGLFDVTIEPLMRLYGFRNDETQSAAYPSDAQLKSFQDAIGFHHIHAEGNTVWLDNPVTQIDFGGIGCGYALDEIKSIFHHAGIKNGMVNFSGDILVLGNPPFAPQWEVEILNPKKPESNKKILVSDVTVSTSGVYENRRSSGNSSWGHIINPKSLKPEENIASVTVISESSVAADVFSTTLFIDGSLSGQLKQARHINEMILVN